MRKMTCPSCGASYNGKRCRSCHYENFGEEITYGKYSNRESNLPIEDTARKTIPEKTSSERKKTARKKHPLVRFLVLLTVINSLMPMLRNWGLKLQTMENRHAGLITAQPEPVLQPENMVILHQEDGITIFTTPEQFANLDHFSLYVHNESSMRVTASAGDIQVNGIDLPRAALVCRAQPGEIGRGWLEPNTEEWEAAGIQELHTLSFSITILRQDGRIGFETGEICITAEGADEIWANS